MNENELLKKIAIAKAKPETLTDISPRDLADLVLVVLQYAKEINKQIVEGKIKGDKGADGADAYNPIPDVDYLSLPTAKAELQKFKEELTSKVLSDAQNALSKLRNGEDGKDAQVTKEHLEMAAKMACDLIDLPDFRKYITEQPEAIRDSLELLQGEERLDASAIKNLPDFVKKQTETFVGTVSGIKEIVAGTNITVDNSNLGYPVISASGGGGGGALDDLTDVVITTPADNEVLAYDNGSGDWINQTAAEAGLAASNHTHLLAAGATDVTASASELNILDGATLTTTELNYVDGVTSAIQTQLDGKVDENAAIVGATKTKITYDAKGLVTAGADATTADIADSNDKRYVTEAEKTKLSNISVTQAVDLDAIETASHAAVTLAGEDFLSLSGQQITANPIDLDNLSATGTPDGTTFLRGDNTWATPAGSGDVSKVGTPVNNQIGVWTGDGTLEGDSSLTWDGTSLNIATAKNFQIAGSTVLADNAGTTTLSNIDAIDATTEATIEAAIDTLANLTSIQGRTVTLADAGANALFGWDDTASAYENLSQAEARTILGLGTAAYEATTAFAAALGADDNYVTDAEKTKLSNLSGTNTGDQTSIIGITGTKAEFNTAVSDGNIMYVGDAPTAHTHTKADLTDVADFLLESEVDADIKTLSLPASTTISAFGATLVDDADNTAARTTLGLGTAATKATDLSDLNEATIEAAIDTLANLTSIQGRTVTLADAGADALLGWDDSASAYQNLSAADARTALGLATGDSPQFTAINLGHASDTTLTRSAAGVVQVEGKTLANLTDGGTFAADISVPDEAYGVGWNGSLEVPTKNAVYDKIETLGGGATTLVKTSTETVNNSATVQNDDTFTFSVSANKIYKVTAFLPITTNGTADFKFNFSLPASAVMYGSCTSETGAWLEFTQAAERDVPVSGTALYLSIIATIVTSGTAGTATFQWAQNTMTVVDTQVLAGAWMTYELLN